MLRVPVIPTFKLDRLPRGFAWDDVQRILAVIDRSKFIREGETRNELLQIVGDNAEEVRRAAK